MMRVVVISDRRLSGLALVNAFAGLPGADIVAEVNQVGEAKPYCERGEADVVVVDASVLARAELGQVPGLAASPRSLMMLLGTLTPREREVLVLLGAGLSNQRIGTLLGVTQATVKSHVGRVLAKLKLESRLQAGLVAGQVPDPRAATLPSSARRAP
jgi:DNA-binding CsgD family transcriptional regulator